MSDETNPTPDSVPADENAREQARQRMISRRRIVQTALIAVPVLLTLRAVPARAGGNGGTRSQTNCEGTRQHPTGNVYTKSGHCEKPKGWSW